MGNNSCKQCSISVWGCMTKFQCRSFQRCSVTRAEAQQSSQKATKSLYLLYHELQRTASPGAGAFSCLSLHFVPRVCRLAFSIQRNQCFRPPPLFFPLPTIFLVSLLSPLLGEQLMRNEPLRHIKPYKKAMAVIQWLSLPNPFSFKWLF